MKKFLAVFAVVLGFAHASQANIMIEPYLGYEMGKTKNSDGTFNGSDMGLRLAYAAPVFFWVGLDATSGVSGTFKPDSGGNDDGKRTTVSGVVGVDFPILLRAWAGYSLMNEIKFDTLGKFKGSGTKVGIGFTGLPFISLNFEYINEKFTEVDGATLSTDFKNDSYLISVSLPFKF